MLSQKLAWRWTAVLIVAFLLFPNTDQNPCGNRSTNVSPSKRSLEALLSISGNISSKDKPSLEYGSKNCSDNLPSNDEDSLDYGDQNYSESLYTRNKIFVDYGAQNYSGKVPPNDKVVPDCESETRSGHLPPNEEASHKCGTEMRSDIFLSNEKVSGESKHEIHSGNLVLNQENSSNSESRSRWNNLTQADEVFPNFECQDCSPSSKVEISSDSESQPSFKNFTQTDGVSFDSESKETESVSDRDESLDQTNLKQIIYSARSTGLRASNSNSTHRKPLRSLLCGNTSISNEYDAIRPFDCVNTSLASKNPTDPHKIRTSVDVVSTQDPVSTRDKNIEPRNDTASNVTVWAARSGFPHVAPSREEVLISCRGRCGLDVHVPCSCVQICFINGNCCYDMSEECPHLVMSERSRLRHLLQADIECSDLTGTFMVTSCSRRSRYESDDVMNEFNLHKVTSKDWSSEGVTFPPDSEETTVRFTNSSEDPRLSENVLLSVLFAAPLTDRVTGLVYRNRSVALCNGAQPSDIVPWKVEFKLMRPERPRSIQDLPTIANNRKYKYTAPDMPEGYSVGSPCLGNAIRSCKPEWIVDQPDLEDKCLNGGITYYKAYDYKMWHNKYYANIHCAICDLGRDSMTSPMMPYYYSERVSEFSVTMSFTSEGRLRVSVHAPVGAISWRTIDCNLTASEQGNWPCENECDKDEKRLPDGRCVAFRRIRFAVATGNCLFTVSRSMEKELLRMVTCYLETYGNAAYVAENVHFEIVYDAFIGIPLLQMSLGVMYLRNDPLEVKIQFWRELALLVHDADFCCEKAVPANVSCKAYTCLVGDLVVARMKSISVLPLKDSPFLTEQEKRSKGSWSVFCESHIKLQNHRIYTNFMCLKVQVNDSHLDFFHRAAQVSCLEDKVEEKVLHRRARQSCSSIGLRLHGAVFKICSLILFTSTTQQLLKLVR